MCHNYPTKQTIIIWYSCILGFIFNEPVLILNTNSSSTNKKKDEEKQKVNHKGHSFVVLMHRSFHCFILYPNSFNLTYGISYDNQSVSPRAVMHIYHLRCD